KDIEEEPEQELPQKQAPEEINQKPDLPPKLETKEKEENFEEEINISDTQEELPSFNETNTSEDLNLPTFQEEQFSLPLFSQEIFVNKSNFKKIIISKNHI